MAKRRRKFREQVTETIPKHKHCVVCGSPISLKDKYCGPNCEETEKKMNRRRTYTLILMMVMFPVILILMTLLSAGR